MASDHALGAVEAAGAEGADSWAPVLLQAADSLFREAQAELEVQRARLAPLRNFDASRVYLAAARGMAEEAAATARATKAAVQTESNLALDQATQVLLEAEAVRDARVLDAAARRKLQAARVQAVEAHLRQEEGDYVAARDLALSAEGQALEVLDNAASRAARFVDQREVSQWRDWFEETLEESRRDKAAAIVIFKERNELVLYQAGREVRRYPAEMGRKSLERKLYEGDGATPEGRYKIVTKKEGAETIYHRALLLDYPTQADLARLADAKRRKQVRGDARPGGAIEIHGQGGKGWDWTRGCVAMTNEDIDELWSRVGVNTPVTIVGGDGRDGTFSRVARSAAKRRN